MGRAYIPRMGWGEEPLIAGVQPMSSLDDEPHDPIHGFVKSPRPGVRSFRAFTVSSHDFIKMIH